MQGGKCMRMGVVPSPGLVTRASPGVRPVPSPVQATQKRALSFMRWGNGCVRSRAHVRCRSRGGRIVWRGEHAPIYRPQQSQANEGACRPIAVLAHRQHPFETFGWLAASDASMLCVDLSDVTMPLPPEVRLQHETSAETMIVKADGACSHEASACV